MPAYEPSVVRTRSTQTVLATNKVIRNTYALLAMTLVFSAITAGVAMVSGAQPVHWIFFLAVFLGMPMLINAMRNSVWALPLTFAFTGLVGWLLGPIVSLYLALPNGGAVVTYALGTTGVMFLGLSGYALASRKDFSFMSGFLMVGLLVALVGIVANIFLQIPALSLALSSMVVMLMAGCILWDTSRMVHGGETNYVLMTVSLFANIAVLFMHLLNLFSAFSSE